MGLEDSSPRTNRDNKPQNKKKKRGKKKTEVDDPFNELAKPIVFGGVRRRLVGKGPDDFGWWIDLLLRCEREFEQDRHVTGSMILKPTVLKENRPKTTKKGNTNTKKKTRKNQKKNLRHTPTYRD